LVIDIGIGLVLLVALYIGYQRGVVQPLMVYLFFLLAILIILRDRHSYTAAMEKYLHLNAVLDVFLALIVAVVAGYLGGHLGSMIHRMPVVRGLDGFLGIFVNLFFALLMCYLLLSAMVVLDRAFAPMVASPGLSLAQVEQLKRQLASNPLTSSLVDSRDIARLEAQARLPGGAHLAETPQLSQLVSGYEDFLQPQLMSSRLAPIVLRIGQRIPFVGHVGASDLPPKRAPAPSPSPTPKKA